MQLPQILEWILLDSPLKTVVLPFGDAPSPTALLLSTQLSVNMLGYRTQLTTSFFSSDLLWLTLLMKRIFDWSSVKSAVSQDPD